MFRILALIFFLAIPAHAGEWQQKFKPFEEANVKPYHYFAVVKSVYDADTITVQVDLGFGVQIEQRLRLYGIDAWEVRGEERPIGLIARDWLRDEIGGERVVFVSFDDRKGKYGRFLALIYTEGQSLSINDRLVQLGHAEYRNY